MLNSKLKQQLENAMNDKLLVSRTKQTQLPPSKTDATPILNRKTQLDTDNYNTVRKTNQKHQLDELERKMKVNQVYQITAQQIKDKIVYESSSSDDSDCECSHCNTHSIFDDVFDQKDLDHMNIFELFKHRFENYPNQKQKLSELNVFGYLEELIGNSIEQKYAKSNISIKQLKFRKQKAKQLLMQDIRTTQIKEMKQNKLDLNLTKYKKYFQANKADKDNKIELLYEGYYKAQIQILNAKRFKSNTRKVRRGRPSDFSLNEKENMEQNLKSRKKPQRMYLDEFMEAGELPMR